MSAETEDAAALAGLDNLEVSSSGGSSRPSAGDIGARVWRSLWPKALAVVIVLAIWQLVYLANYQAARGPARAGPGVPRPVAPAAARPAVEGDRPDPAPGRGRVRAGRGGRHRGRAGRGPGPAGPGRGRLTDHRPADDPVRGLDPVRDHPVRQQLHRHPVHGHHHRLPVHRQRPDRRGGLHPAAAAAGGQDHGPAPVRAVPQPDPAGRAAVVRGRSQAGLGLRLARPAGR